MTKKGSLNGGTPSSSTRVNPAQQASSRNKSDKNETDKNLTAGKQTEQTPNRQLQTTMDTYVGKTPTTSLTTEKPSSAELSELMAMKFDLDGLNEEERLVKYEKLKKIFQHTTRFKSTSNEVKRLWSGALQDLLAARARSTKQANLISNLNESLNSSKKAAEQASSTKTDLEKKISELENQLQKEQESVKSTDMSKPQGMDDATLIRGLRIQLNEALDKVKDQQKVLQDQVELIDKLQSDKEKLKKRLSESESAEELTWQLEQKNDMLRKAQEELNKTRKELDEERQRSTDDKNRSKKAQSTQTDNQNERLEAMNWPPLSSVNQTGAKRKSSQPTESTANPGHREAAGGSQASGTDHSIQLDWIQRNIPIRRRNEQNHHRANPSHQKSKPIPTKEFIIAIARRPTTLFTREEALPKVKEALKPIKSTSITDIYQNKNGKVIVKYREKEDGCKVLDTLKAIEEDFEFWKVGEKRRLVVKRIHKTLSKAQILAELAENGIQARPDQVHVLNRADYVYQRAILTLDEHEAKQVLQRTDHVKIDWRACPIEPHVRPLQCYVCGGFNHSGYRQGKLVCENEKKCLNCAEKKFNGHVCNRDQDGHDRVKCINCGSTEHPASDKRCPIYQAIIKDLQARW